MIAIVQKLIAALMSKQLKKLDSEVKKVDKWVDVMKDKVILVKYITKTRSTELAIASIKNKKPIIEFSLKGFFNKDKKTIENLKTIADKNSLDEVFMAFINDYKVVINQHTGEVILKEKLTLRERFKYKALWKKLNKEYTNSKNIK